ncbi:hypothetical protein M6D81_06590 [Paenibacillus sp. J5C_2022]|nr:hypothetical protein [Paenibacillus sp. J5C2022]
MTGEEKAGAAGMSRRQALAALGAGTIAAAAGTFMLPGSKVFGEGAGGAEPSTEQNGESVGLVTDHPVMLTTIADIRSGAAVPDAGTLYYMTDPGREGEFFYDAADTASLDDDGIIFVSATGARFKRLHADNLNVKWFGAKGDNVTDDSAAFQKAIEIAEARIGGTVYIPMGNYVVTNLRVKYHYVSIRGEGYQATRLINRHQTNPLLDIRLEQVNTITHFELADVMIKNEVQRPGDYPIVYAYRPVGAEFRNVFFQNSTQLVGGGHYRGNGIRLEDAFEVTFYSCAFRQWQKGYAVDMPNTGVNVGNIHFIDCLWMYCGHALIYGRGKGSMSNSLLLSNPKFVGWQGGHYVRDNRVRYFQTVATSDVVDADWVPVADVSMFKSNEVVMVGSQERLQPGYIEEVDMIGGRIRLDRNVVKINSGDTVLQGTVAVHQGWRSQELKINVGHFEGLDVGVYASNRFGLLTLDSVHSGSCSNIILVDDQIKYLSLSNSRLFYNDVNKVMTDWWTVVRITKLEDSNNIILLENNYMEPGDAEQLMDRQVINHTPHKPFVRIMDRFKGIQYYSGGLGTVYHDEVKRDYNRSDTNKTSRQRWTESGVEKWSLNFKDVDGHLAYKLATKTQDSLQLDGTSGNVVIGAGWNEPHLQLGNYHLWIDSLGNLRIKHGTPTSSDDGERFKVNGGNGIWTNGE